MAIGEEYRNVKESFKGKLTDSSRKMKSSWNTVLDRLFSMWHSSWIYQPVLLCPVSMASSERVQERRRSEASREEYREPKRMIPDKLTVDTRQTKPS